MARAERHSRESFLIFHPLLVDCLVGQRLDSGRQPSSSGTDRRLATESSLESGFLLGAPPGEARLQSIRKTRRN